MRYELTARLHGRAAKTRALVYGGILHAAGNRRIILDARDDEDAWAQCERLVLPDDKRPLQGVSYVRDGRCPDIYEDGTQVACDYKVGQPVRLHNPYFGFAATEEGFRAGVISEVLDATHYSIALTGYGNRFVDFSTREFAPAGGAI